MIPDQTPTLIHLLRRRALELRDRVAYIFLHNGETPAAQLTWGELDRSACAIAAALHARDAAGDRALLMYPPGLEFVTAFFGCLYAGTIAVPAYPPRSERDRGRIDGILDDADAAYILTTARLLETMRRRVGWSRDERTQWVATDALPSEPCWREPGVGPESVAYLQYTSGSTALPKGVIVSHANVQRNLESIDRGFAHDEGSVSVTWLPHFHDMGLVYGILAPLHGGFTCVMMSPVAFVQRPARWLDAISRYKATHSGGPNFAYGLCARRIAPEQRHQLDLRHWRVAFNGAEPISRDTLDEFFAAFRSCGFAWDAFYPAYGLAEATLKVSGGFVRGAPSGVERAAGPNAASRDDETSPIASGRPAPVGCGRGDADSEIRIVDPASLVDSSPGDAGEIWVRGPGVAQGYWNRPVETEATFGAYVPTGEGPYLRTGDLGFIRDGELFVSGRLKDLMIVRGQNHHPEDIERTASHCGPALRERHGAAFSVPIAGEERLVLVYELERARPIDAGEVARALRRTLSEGHQLQLHALVLTEPGTLPRTPSGKIQRQACRSAFLQRSLAVVQEIVEESDRELSGGVHLAVETVLATPSAERAPLLEAYLTALASEAAAGTAPLDAHRAFSSWGLDSLAAIELKNRIEIDLGVEVPVVRFLDGTTPRDLAATVLRALESQERSRVHEAAGADRSAEYPASYAQRAFLVSHQSASGNPLYNLAAAFRIRQALDSAALRRSIQHVVDRHAALRTGFVMRGQEPIALERKDERACVEIEDALAWDEALLQRRLHEAATHPFDLEGGPLLRVTAFVRSADEWILLLSVHHVAADFRSVEVLIEELTRGYASGSPPDRRSAPRSIDYADYARWQRTMLAGPDGERLWAYWRTQLRPPWPSLEHLGGRRRPAEAAPRSASVPFRIENPLLERLHDFARSRHTTVFVVLLAALQVLLHRRTGETDILIGCPARGRRAGFANVVGCFVNPVVLRGDLSDDPTWIACVDRVRQSVHEALEHQDYPFSLLVERLRMARDPARSPLFQVMLVWQQEDRRLAGGALAALSVGDTTRPLELAGLTLEPIPLSTDAARYELTMMMAPTPGGAAGCIKYDSSRWDAVAVEHLAGQFLALLEGTLANPWRPSSSLPLHPASSPTAGRTAARRAVAREAIGRRPLLHELIGSHASRRPHAAAVVCGADRLTYAELNARANQIARHLRAAGAGHDALVGLCLDRSVWMVAALLGVWKCGAAYVPLDPAYPDERLALLVTHSRLRTLVTQKAIAPRLPRGEAQTVLIDADWNQIAGRSDDDLGLDVAPRQMAYAIYTSGSTGIPKGVMIEHRSVANLYAALCERIYADLRSDLNVALNASFGFDAAVKQIVILARGSTLHVLPDRVRASASALLAYAAANEIDVLDCTPSLLRALVDAGLLRARYPRLILAGGEPIDRALWSVLSEGEHAVRIYNVYGPTECTVDASACAIDTDAPSIGFPLANVQAHVLDSSLAPLPPDVVGELCLGGVCLARGYLHAPDATAERFIPNPFSDDPGARLYKTGDLVRRTVDGSLVFVRRADDQVKVRGFRVEPSEIEAAMRRHPGVRDAAVAKLQDRFGDDQLVAYVVPAPERPNACADLREFLRAVLPAYMIPSAFVPVGALPLTVHGKLDRAALASIRPRVVEDRFPRGDRPRSHLEDVLTMVWARALGVAEVGLHDSFFELGGHSLLAMRVSAELEQVLPVTVPLITLFFENATIERFAAAIVRHRADDVDFERIALAVKRLDAVSDDDAEEVLRQARAERLLGASS